MTLEEFKKNLDLYSADLSLWPQDMLKPALRLMEKNDIARAAFEAELKIDHALRLYDPLSSMHKKLEDTIMARIKDMPQQARRPYALKWRPAWVWPSCGGLLAAAIVGFFVGFSPAPQQDSLLDPVFYAEAQIIADNSDLYDWSVF